MCRPSGEIKGDKLELEQDLDHSDHLEGCCDCKSIGFRCFG